MALSHRPGRRRRSLPSSTRRCGAASTTLTCASAWKRPATSRQRTTLPTNSPASSAPTRKNGSAWSSRPTCAPSELQEQDVVELNFAGMQAGKVGRMAACEIDGELTAVIRHQDQQVGERVRLVTAMCELREYNGVGGAILDQVNI